VACHRIELRGVERGVERGAERGVVFATNTVGAKRCWENKFEGE